MLKNMIIASAAFAFTACSATRPYDSLTVGEKTDFEKCRGEEITKQKIIENKTGTAGGLLDGIINAPEKIAEANRTAARICAGKMNVDPSTVPGLRP